MTTEPLAPKPGSGHPAFHACMAAMAELHTLKSGGYGTGDDPFANFTATAAVSGRQRWEYPIERMIEKITRINSLTAQGRFGELREEFRDLVGLAGCCDAMLEDDYYDQQEHVFTDEEVAEINEKLGPLVRGEEPTALIVDDGPRNYLRLDPGFRLAERRWQESGVGLTD